MEYVGCVLEILIIKNTTLSIFKIKLKSNKLLTIISNNERNPTNFF